MVPIEGNYFLKMRLQLGKQITTYLEILLRFLNIAYFLTFPVAISLLVILVPLWKPSFAYSLYSNSSSEMVLLCPASPQPSHSKHFRLFLKTQSRSIPLLKILWHEVQILQHNLQRYYLFSPTVLSLLPMHILLM